MDQNAVPQLHFVGSIPRHYDEYLGPMFFEPYAKDLITRVDISGAGTVLELACGTGRVTAHMRKILQPTARLIASDVSVDMLSIAKRKLTGQDIEWKIIDAQTLPFDDNSLDLVVCYFGYMFVPDKDKSYREVLRVLRRGGLFVMATWGKLEDNQASYVFRKTVNEYLETQPEMYNLPFSMHDPRAITEQLRHAGFEKVKSQKVAKKAYAQNVTWAAHGLVHGGSLYNEIVKRNPSWIGEISSIVERELGEKYGKMPMQAPMSAIVTQAWK
jgi:ubiquinone/menaquinone biosynthesis C-methylase UbiE